MNYEEVRDIYKNGYVEILEEVICGHLFVKGSIERVVKTCLTPNGYGIIVTNQEDNTEVCIAGPDLNKVSIYRGNYNE
jgi:hypothetical protein